VHDVQEATRDQINTPRAPGVGEVRHEWQTERPRNDPARILLLTQNGHQVTDIARTLSASRGTIYNTYKRYLQKKARTPLRDVLQEAPRSGRPLKFDSRVEAKATMIACSTPPAGRARWTLAGIEVRHAIRKGQMITSGHLLQTPAEQFYALAA